MGTFFKITKKKDIRLNNISKFLRLNLTWIHFKIKEKRMYPYKFKNGLEKKLNRFYIKKMVHFTYNKLVYLRMSTF